MRYALLSHIAGNFRALESVNGYIDGLRVDETIVLGGITGIYPCVDKVVDLLREYGFMVCKSRRDETFVANGPYDSWSCVNLVKAHRFAFPRTSPTAKAYIKRLPYIVSERDLAFVGDAVHVDEGHGFVQTEKDIVRMFSRMEARLVFLGGMANSEQFVAFPDGQLQSPDGPVELHGGRALVCVGGIGSRYHGGDRPGIAVYDEARDAVEFHGVLDCWRPITEDDLPGDGSERLWSYYPTAYNEMVQ